MQLLAQLQGMLERMYALGDQHPVGHFLVTCPELLGHLAGDAAGFAASERVVLAQTEDSLDLAVYLDATLLARLEEDDPLDSLNDDNLGDFLTAVEGVSHFVYLVWNAMLDKQVTLLELELQAEVDKFLMAAHLLARQRGGVPQALHDRLFRQFRLAPGMDATQRRRYLDASRYAGDYCARLARRYLGGRTAEPMAPELRRFYRLSQRGKLRHIAGRRA
jgi:hypothetical protein